MMHLSGILILNIYLEGKKVSVYEKSNLFKLKDLMNPFPLHHLHPLPEILFVFVGRLGRGR